jgi:uncharacterized repeat protein (TIGR02543 family)
MTREGYGFDGWYTTSSFTTKWNFETDTVSANITLYARWVGYTVTFNANGGIPAPTAQTVPPGGTVTEPPAMTRTGYIFGGWYLESTFANQWDFANYPVNTDRTLYAKWNDIPGTAYYTVSFETTGGTSMASQRLAANTAVARPANPARTGYTFADWYSDMAMTAVYNFSSPVTGNITLYAKWNAPGYTVVYNANGGSGAMADSNFTYGAYQSLRANTFTRNGYDFAGWATTATGAIARTDREAVGTLSSTNGATVNLYAVWNTVETVSSASLAAKLVQVSLGAGNNKTYILEANANESLAPQTLSYSGRSNIVIILRGVGAERIISLSADGSLFTVASGVTLVLDNNITLQGRTVNNNSLVTVNSGGRLVMNAGAKITSNKVTSAGGSSDWYGGGVTVNGTFTMNGGDIYDNSSSTAYSGGGVAVRGTFTMNSGKIYNNGSTYISSLSCGGVYIQQGTFTMNGGEISGNTASGNGSGGVNLGINYSNTFTMNDGKISNNTGRDGGGVYASLSSSTGSGYNQTFIMNGGEISGNGGGVYVSSSSSGTVTFTKTGGIISNNNAGQGRMVYATANSVTKRRENNAGEGINLYYYGGSNSSAYSGEWDY